MPRNNNTVNAKRFNFPPRDIIVVPALPTAAIRSRLLLFDQGHIAEAAGKGEINHVEVWALQWLNDFYF